jgi:predicted amidohydrolase YtcJ
MKRAAMPIPKDPRTSRFDGEQRALWLGLLLLTVSGLSTPAAAQETADLILHHGRIVTVDDRRPEAEALAVRGDRILALGDNEEMLRLAGPRTRQIDAQGRLVLPGFIEGHGHFLSLGQSQMRLDASQATSWDEIVRQVADAARQTRPGTWIVGRGWHQGKWRSPPEDHVEGYPQHAALSAVTPEHPVLLTHGTGHMALANAKAMELANITAETPDPPGGHILRAAGGQPTGVFRENASSPLYRAWQRSLAGRPAEQIAADTNEALRLAQEQCFRFGVTSFQDAGSSLADVQAMRRQIDADALQIRLWVMLNEGNDVLEARLAQARTVGYGNHRLTVRAIKRMSDGALGTHGAWLLTAYDDLPLSTGHAVTPMATIRRTAELARQHDYQLCVHAIGDRANREVLDLFEEVFVAHPTQSDWRWRIEHAQHIDPADIPRFGSLGVIASMQGVHCTSDGPFVVARLGWRRAQQGSYAWQSLLKSQATVINGTDAPVEHISPIASFYSSVTRRMANGESFFEEQCMSREQALRSYTRDAAFAAFEEDLKGSLAPGKLADIVMLSDDILRQPADRIPATRVLLTIVGGKIVYAAE